MIHHKLQINTKIYIDQIKLILLMFLEDKILKILILDLEEIRTLTMITKINLKII
jgi:hypothetical protein